MILLTGASGFVGQAILAALEQRCSIRVALRNPDSVSPRSCLDVREAFIQPGQDWAGILEGISGIVHCACRDHQRGGGHDEMATTVKRALTRCAGWMRRHTQ